MYALSIQDRLENEVQRATMAFYAQFGVELRRFSERRTGRTRIREGWPDLACFHRGKHAFWFHETKRDKGGKQSLGQRSMQELIEACGVPYLLGGVQAASEHLTKLGLLP